MAKMAEKKTYTLGNSIIVKVFLHLELSGVVNPASILYKSIAGRYRPVNYPDGPITARYRFIKNAYWVV